MIDTKTKNPINFFCVGAQKAGTTTLHDILIQHPDIYLPKEKETHFFDMEDRYNNGIEWYINTFYSNYSGEKICGEITPCYLYFDKVPKRLFKEFGSNLKLVFLFRNPIDRAFSHYLMTKKRLLEDNSFEDAIALETERIDKGYYENLHYSYLSRGLYATQLNRFLKYFPLENMHFINFEEDYVKNRANTIVQLLKFLEVPIVNLNVDIHSHKSQIVRFKYLQRILFKGFSGKNLFSFVPKNMKVIIRKILLKIAFRENKNEKLNEKTREDLKSYFENDIKELEIITRKDFSNWI